ncbi:MAG: hypothetical protein IT236_08160 [Bacteroidia bacterium]|nr:hypothetical protein [Bacteroidia bacterium]
MRFLFINIFLVLSAYVLAQDKIYLLNGEVRKGKVTEVGTEEIRFMEDGDNLSLLRSDVLLIEFINGAVEVINVPAENKVFANTPKAKERHLENSKKLATSNLVSINSLALCNSDAAFFYEKLLDEKRYGVGLMAAFNFNSRCSILNSHIFSLTNGRKNYDLGGFANLYLGLDRTVKSFYVGVMIKYMALTFDKTVVNGTSITNKPASGNQLATIFTCGNQRFFDNGFFIKTIYGLGGFNLNGEYKDEFNYQNSNNGFGAQRPSNRKFLGKFYFGVNMGLCF